MNQKFRQHLELIPLTANIGREFAWVQPKASESRYELRAAEACHAELVIDEWHQNAVAHTYGDGWEFVHAGFFNQRVEIRLPGASYVLWQFTPSFWGGGTLVISEQERYQWKLENGWKGRYVFLDEAENAVLRLTLGLGEFKWQDFFKTQAVLEIPQSSAALTSLPLLATLGFYLVFIHQQEIAATAAITASV